MKIHHSLFFALICLTTFACQPEGEGNDTKAVNKEMRSRKIRRITAAQILDKANEIGNTSVKRFQNALLQGISHEGDSLKSCTTIFNRNKDTIGLPEQSSVKRILLRRDDGLIAKFGAMEQQLIEAYRYNLRNKLEMSSNIQKEGDSIVFYTAPISLSASCMSCHGRNKVQENILSKKYPHDTLTGYKVNDVIGIWCFRLNKKAVVLSIE